MNVNDGLSLEKNDMLYSKWIVIIEAQALDKTINNVSNNWPKERDLREY